MCITSSASGHSLRYNDSICYLHLHEDSVCQVASQAPKQQKPAKANAFV
jgi:hypothetical protein